MKFIAIHEKKNMATRGQTFLAEEAVYNSLAFMHSQYAQILNIDSAKKNLIEPFKHSI